jgi:hypothetical protein
MISKPLVHSAQTVYLSCVKISTIPKRIEMCFHLSIITKEYHRVHPKRLLSLWYVWRKPWTYLESRLALSPNRPKRAFTWASSPRRTIGCIQNDFYVRRKPCTYLALTLTTSANGPKWDLTWPTLPRGSIGCVQNDFWAYGTFNANHAPILRHG